MWECVNVSMRQFGNVSICYLRSGSGDKHHNWCNWNADVADVADGMDGNGFYFWIRLAKRD